MRKSQRQTYQRWTAENLQHGSQRMASPKSLLPNWAQGWMCDVSVIGQVHFFKNRSSCWKRCGFLHTPDLHTHKPPWVSWRWLFSDRSSQLPGERFGYFGTKLNLYAKNVPLNGSIRSMSEWKPPGLHLASNFKVKVTFKGTFSNTLTFLLQ